jgi:hypothetical protein
MKEGETKGAFGVSRTANVAANQDFRFFSN